MGWFGIGKKAQKSDKAESAVEHGFDMTELAAAIAALNGEEPLSGPVIVSASVFPVTMEINMKEAEAEKMRQAEAAKREANPEVGYQMQDGTIYIGRFKSKNGVEKKWFAAAEDAKDENGRRLSLTFNEAATYATNSRAHGHDNWVVPTGWAGLEWDGVPDVLGAMFNSKGKGAFKGTFDETGSESAGWYWSSTLGTYTKTNPKIQRFSDGFEYYGNQTPKHSVRLVRSSAV